MFTSRHKLQILWAIIVLYVIGVMNVFVPFKAAPNSRLHHKSMFWHVVANCIRMVGAIHQHVAILIERTAPLPSDRTFALGVHRVMSSAHLLFRFWRMLTSLHRIMGEASLAKFLASFFRQMTTETMTYFGRAHIGSALLRNLASDALAFFGNQSTHTPKHIWWLAMGKNTATLTACQA